MTEFSFILPPIQWWNDPPPPFVPYTRRNHPSNIYYPLNNNQMSPSAYPLNNHQIIPFIIPYIVIVTAINMKINDIVSIASTTYSSIFFIRSPLWNPRARGPWTMCGWRRQELSGVLFQGTMGCILGRHSGGSRPPEAKGIIPKERP